MNKVTSNPVHLHLHPLLKTVFSINAMSGFFSQDMCPNHLWEAETGIMDAQSADISFMYLYLFESVPVMENGIGNHHN